MSGSAICRAYPVLRDKARRRLPYPKEVRQLLMEEERLMKTGWQRFLYQPCLPLGDEGRRATGSRDHIELSRAAASEGMVLLKNEGGILPLKHGTKVALFGKGTADYVKGGGGSGQAQAGPGPEWAGSDPAGRPDHPGQPAD
jgi:beta-glucosidase-like glycosyl hydrolase